MKTLMYQGFQSITKVIQKVIHLKRLVDDSMHPKQICDEMARMGCPLVLDNNDLYVENADNIPAHYVEFARSYKSRIIKYLQGNYANNEHAIRQTIDRIVDFMLMITLDKVTTYKLTQWLNNDEQSLTLVNQLLQKLAENGWHDATQPIANFETIETDKLSKEIFDHAMAYFKKVKS